MISLRNVSCRMDRQDLLQDVTAELGSGCVAVIGPNGAGKSTLLRLCADGGRQLPLARLDGAVLLDGQPLRDIPVDVLARRRAFLPQQHADALRLQVGDVLELAAWPQGLSSLPAALRAGAIALWELEHLLQRPYTHLSGGERQRVQLARTWLQMRLQPEPAQRLWLLDEPQTALDLPHQQRLQDCLRREGAAGGLVLFSTHDLNFALRAADRILALRQGRLMAIGTPEEMTDPALLQEIFGVAFARLPHPGDGRPWVIPQ